MDNTDRFLLRLQSRLEQVREGLDRDDDDAEASARQLIRTLADGSKDELFAILGVWLSALQAITMTDDAAE